MPRSFCASRSISMRLASGDTPRTKNGFSSILIVAFARPSHAASRRARSSDPRVEALLAGLGIFGEELPQGLDDAAEVLGVAALDRALALGDEALGAGQIARL